MRPPSPRQQASQLLEAFSKVTAAPVRLAYNGFSPMESKFKSGFVAVVGRPNAGKSTLVNTLVGQKVAIVSSRPQTTRNRIQGILNRDDAQIVLVDTPGIHQPQNVLSRQMMDEAQHALEGVDVLSLIVDASASFGAGDQFSIEWVRRFHGPIFLLLN